MKTIFLFNKEKSPFEYKTIGQSSHCFKVTGYSLDPYKIGEILFS